MQGQQNVKIKVYLHFGPYCIHELAEKKTVASNELCNIPTLSTFKSVKNAT